jgi:hypothetical protein
MANQATTSTTFIPQHGYFCQDLPELRPDRISEGVVRRISCPIDLPVGALAIQL